jgi:hypothetical protein
MLIRGSPTQGVLKMAWLVPRLCHQRAASRNTTRTTFSDRRSEHCSARVASGRGFCRKTPWINGTNSGTTFQPGPRCFRMMTAAVRPVMLEKSAPATRRPSPNARTTFASSFRRTPESRLCGVQPPPPTHGNSLPVTGPASVANAADPLSRHKVARILTNRANMAILLARNAKTRQ